MRLLPLLAAFLTPLLFFVESRDQFELPKLTFLAVMGAVTLGLAFLLRGRPRLTPLGISLLALWAVQGIASLPGVSLSWRTSLLGDYDNFSGFLTSTGYLAWFFALTLVLKKAWIERAAFFASLAAVLSALYALAQHAGFDLVQWNPESVIGNREFASLGNPNFLAAYLAMSLPLLLMLGGLHHHSRPAAAPDPSQVTPGPGGVRPVAKGYILFGTLTALGVLFLLSGTGKGAGWFNQDPSNPPVGLAITFGLPFLTFALVRFGNLSSWIPLSLSAILLAFGLFRTGSRGGFLGASAGLAVLLLIVLTDRDLRRLLRQWLSTIPPLLRYGLPTLAAGAVLAFNSAFVRRLADTILRFPENVAVSRLHIWKPALRIIRENPLLGIGLDNFKIAFPQYSGYDFNRIDGIFVSSRTAHNELLQAAATTGLIGLAVFLGVLAVFLATGWRAYRASSVADRWVLAGLVASAAAYQVQNLFSFGVSSINYLWVLALAGVQVLAPQAGPVPVPAPEGPAKRLNRMGVLGVALSILALSVPALVRLTADIAFGRGSSALDYLKESQGRMTEKERSLYVDYGLLMIQRATSLVPLEVKYRLYLALALERKAEMDPARANAWQQEALENYDRTIGMSPYNAYYYNNRARIALALYHLTRDPARLAIAEEAGRRSVVLAPGSPFFKVQWAVALMKSGKGSEAGRVIAEACSLNPDFACRALVQLADDEDRKGNGGFAFDLLGEALRANTLCAEAYYYRGLMLEKTGRRKDSLKDLERAKALKPHLTKR